MKTKWCEKCSVEFDWNYTFNELHNDNVVIPVEYELKNCPYCNEKLKERRNANEGL
jgi:NAD-dependent SIR2 family protein deacetylase